MVCLGANGGKCACLCRKYFCNVLAKLRCWLGVQQVAVRLALEKIFNKGTTSAHACSICCKVRMYQNSQGLLVCEALQYAVLRLPGNHW